MVVEKSAWPITCWINLISFVLSQSLVQKVCRRLAARLTGRDLKLAERSRELRKEEFIQMQKDRVIIHTGHLAGHLLAEVLLADLMENTEVMQPQALPAAA